MQNRRIVAGRFPAHLERREFLKLGGLGVVGLMAAAATVRGARAQDKIPSLDNIKANLSKVRYGDFNPNYLSKWPFIIALTLGYLEEVGIEELEVILSEQYMPGLVGGSLELAHGDTSSFIGGAEASGLPIKIVSIFRDKEYWIMGARKGIETAEDLKGKTVTGGSLEGRNTWVQKQILVDMGLDPEKDVSIVPSSGGSDNRLAAMINGTIDAGSVFPRHEAGLTEAGGKFIYKKLVSAPQESIGAMGSFIDGNEDTLYAWTLADLKARQWLFDRANKDQAYKIMRDYGYEIPPEFEAQYELELDQISPDGGFESGEDMDNFLAQLAETGEVKSGVDWREHIDMRFVWAAQDALGLPRRPATL